MKLRYLQNAEQYPDYYEIIKNPMDLQKVTDKLADKVYTTLNAFLEDINLIVSNAIEYNPESDPMKIATRVLSSFLTRVINITFPNSFHVIFL
jgi:hypothetical protein